MNKKKIKQSIFLILLIAILLVIYFNRDYLLLKYRLLKYSNNTYFPLLYYIVLLISLVFLAFLFYKYDMWKKLISFYKVNLNGLIILEVVLYPVIMEENLADLNQFKNVLYNIQTKYNFINFNIEYSAHQIKISVKTDGSILLRDGNIFLDDFSTHLNKLLNTIPDNKVLINLNINGEANGIYQNIIFSIVNKKKQVGLNKDVHKKGLFKRFFYVHK
ncbi:MAG: hypothetical protein ACOCQW_04755 [Halanaerobiaceae bacterium]